MRSARTWVLDSLLLFAVGSALVWPLLHTAYLDYWGSAAGSVVADARFLAEHWPHPRWQPLWFGGARFDDLYGPFPRYAIAALIRYGSLPPPRAYHVFIALLYAAGIAGVYLLVRTGSHSRPAAWTAALASAFTSPSFLLLPSIRADALHVGPQRLNALVRQGDAAHIAGLALLPFALAAVWAALERGDRRLVPLAGALAAGVLSCDYSAALAAAAFLPALMWSLWITRVRKPGTATDSGLNRRALSKIEKAGDSLQCALGARVKADCRLSPVFRFFIPADAAAPHDVAVSEFAIWRRAASIAALALALCGFWLTPSFIGTMATNLRLGEWKGTLWSPWILLAAANVFVLLSARWARGRKEAAWPVFACGSLLFTGVYVLGGYALNIRLVDEPVVLVPELDLALILAGVEALRRISARGTVARVAVVLLLLASLAGSRHYVRHPWRLYRIASDYRSRIEYRVPEWAAARLPGARMMVSGSVRLWYDNWNDLPQISGGAEPAARNPLNEHAVWRIRADQSAELPLLWMRALGVDAVAVHGEGSEEIFHDFNNPKKFAGILPVLFDSGAGDVIYQVRARPAIAWVVDAKATAALRAPRNGLDAEALRAYVAVLERGRPAEAVWESTDAVRIRAGRGEGEAILFQVTYDPNWRASSGEVRRDALGQILILAPRGREEIPIEFVVGLEHAIGRVLSAAALLASALLCLWRKRP